MTERHQCPIPYSGFSAGEEWVCVECGAIWQFTHGADGCSWEAIGQWEELTAEEMATDWKEPE